MPIHSSRSHNANIEDEAEILLIASHTKTITTHSKMSANERATRSRRLKVSAYNKIENAVIAIPAVSNWFRNCKLLRITLYITLQHHYSAGAPRSLLSHRTGKEKRNIVIRIIAIIISAKRKSHLHRQANGRVILRLHFQYDPVTGFVACPFLRS